MGKMKDVLIGAAERLASEKKIDVDTAEDLIRNGEVFGDKDMKWIADYAAGKEEKMNESGFRKSTELQYGAVALSRETADKWATELKEQIRKYGYASVATLYELTAGGDSFNVLKPIFADYDYGWLKEEDIHYVRNRDGYWFNLPTPVKLPFSDASEKSEKKHTKVKLWLVMENDPYWPTPELISAETTAYDAKQEVYASAMRLFKRCLEDTHQPTIERVDKSYIVIDKEDDIYRTFYIVEREVEV